VKLGVQITFSRDADGVEGDLGVGEAVRHAVASCDGDGAGTDGRRGLRWPA
jgi:hypothetical protein